MHLKFILRIPFADYSEIRVKLNDNITMLRYKEFQEELHPDFNSFNKKVRKLTLSPSAGIVPEDTRCIPVLHLSELSAFC